MTLSFHIDEGFFWRGFRFVKGGLEAARVTLKSAGHGEVFAARRRRLTADELEAGAFGSNWPSWKITRSLRARGVEPFEIEPEYESEIREILDHEFKGAMIFAYDTGVPQKNSAKNAVIRATQDLKNRVVKNIADGGLGQNPPRYRRRKLRLQALGKIGNRFGRPPPLGVLTGRWLRSIGARWRPGDI